MKRKRTVFCHDFHDAGVQLDCCSSCHSDSDDGFDGDTHGDEQHGVGVTVCICGNRNFTRQEIAMAIRAQRRDAKNPKSGK